MKKKQFGFLDFFVSFLLGAIPGALLGFGLYVHVGDTWDTWDLYYSYLAAFLFIGGGALIGGVLSVILAKP